MITDRILVHVEDELPNCCEMGDQYISWCVNEENDSYKIFTGWGITVGYYKGNDTKELICYCPFCGKELPNV